MLESDFLWAHVECCERGLLNSIGNSIHTSQDSPSDTNVKWVLAETLSGVNYVVSRMR